MITPTDDDLLTIIDTAFLKARISNTQRDSMTLEADEAGRLDDFMQKILAGESPRMALMLVLQSPPATKGTDAQFNRDEDRRVKTMYSDEHMRKIHEIARKAGIDTAGKTYQGQLGKYHDPMAWVSGTHDVRTVAQAKGMAVTGAVNINCLPDAVPDAPKPLSDRCIKEMEKRYIQRDPGLAERVKKQPKERVKLREKIVARHGSRR